VIDALVGFGGFVPGVELGSLTSRGPYVIGWTDDPGPVPIAIDGHEVRRYAHTIEVVSVRPTLGPGEVEIGPAQMSVSVLSIDGDASMAGPATVFLGDGSANYSVSLPLDATEMAVSDLEILVGPDPSMVLNQGGQFGGMWPAGITLEVRDPSTGAWSLLGDISRQAPFSIDDPATAMSGTGRIELRLTGVAEDPNFGQPTVFVSARASGVIGG
jgi:hypothetical protein